MPEADAIASADMTGFINAAAAAQHGAITGKAVTPLILYRLFES